MHYHFRKDGTKTAKNRPIYRTDFSSVNAFWKKLDDFGSQKTKDKLALKLKEIYKNDHQGFLKTFFSSSFCYPCYDKPYVYTSIWNKMKTTKFSNPFCESKMTSDLKIQNSNWLWNPENLPEYMSAFSYYHFWKMLYFLWQTLMHMHMHTHTHNCTLTIAHPDAIFTIIVIAIINHSGVWVYPEQAHVNQDIKSKVSFPS